MSVLNKNRVEIERCFFTMIIVGFINELSEYTLINGHEDQRTISRLYDTGVLQKTVYYAREYEKEVKPGNHIRQLHYISGGDRLAAIFVRNDGVDTFSVHIRA